MRSLDARRTPTRQAFYRALLKRVSDEKGPSVHIHLGTLASALGVTAAVITRYLKEATDAQWVQAEGRAVPVITILNRAALEEAAGLSPEAKSRE